MEIFTQTELDNLDKNITSISNVTIYGTLDIDKTDSLTFTNCRIHCDKILNLKQCTFDRCAFETTLEECKKANIKLYKCTGNIAIINSNVYVDCSNHRNTIRITASNSTVKCSSGRENNISINGRKNDIYLNSSYSEFYFHIYESQVSGNCDNSRISGTIRDCDLQKLSLSKTYFSADLSESKVNNSARQLIDSLEKTSEGIIAYKTFNEFRQSLDNWKIEEGSIIEETVNTDVTEECGCGVNIASLDWILRKCNNDSVIWKVVILLRDTPFIVVPMNTTGKFRANRIKLLEKIGTVDDLRFEKGIR